MGTLISVISSLFLNHFGRGEPGRSVTWVHFRVGAVIVVTMWLSDRKEKVGDFLDEEAAKALEESVDTVMPVWGDQEELGSSGSL